MSQTKNISLSDFVDYCKLNGLTKKVIENDYVLFRDFYDVSVSYITKVLFREQNRKFIPILESELCLDKDDLVAMSFERLWMKLDFLLQVPSAAVKPWTAKVVNNFLKDQMKKVTRLAELVEDEADEQNESEATCRCHFELPKRVSFDSPFALSNDELDLTYGDCIPDFSYDPERLCSEKELSQGMLLEITRILTNRVQLIAYLAVEFLGLKGMALAKKTLEIGAAQTERWVLSECAYLCGYRREEDLRRLLPIAKPFNQFVEPYVEKGIDVLARYYHHVSSEARQKVVANRACFDDLLSVA